MVRFSGLFAHVGELRLSGDLAEHADARFGGSCNDEQQ